MRVLTYNIHGWLTIDGRENLDGVARVLAESGADVIGLNEVDHPFPTPAGPALAALAERLDMAWAFGACLGQPPGRDDRLSYGNALLSRYPLLSVRSGLFRSYPGKQQRGFLTARIDPGFGPIDVVVTHLDHTDEPTRAAQWDDLIAQFSEGGLPDLIMGDFNCIHPKEHQHRPEVLKAIGDVPVAAHLLNAPHGPTVCERVERDGYVDSVLRLGRTTDGSFIPAAEPVRFDYLWLGGTLADRLADSTVIQETPGREASDHRPIVAEFRD